MASCTYCNSFFLFGGQRDETGHYCNQQCQDAGNLLSISYQFDPNEIAGLVQEVHQGSCPKCGGQGPVDVHQAHRVWSALIMTSWNSSPEMSCKGCAVKRQLGAALLDGVVGWWGFPWGLIMTPVQIVRNVVDMIGGPKASQPSSMLERIVRIQSAAHVVQASQSAQPANG